MWVQFWKFHCFSGRTILWSQPDVWNLVHNKQCAHTLECAGLHTHTHTLSDNSPWSTLDWQPHRDLYYLYSYIANTNHKLHLLEYLKANVTLTELDQRLWCRHMSSYSWTSWLLGLQNLFLCPINSHPIIDLFHLFLWLSLFLFPPLYVIYRVYNPYQVQ